MISFHSCRLVPKFVFCGLVMLVAFPLWGADSGVSGTNLQFYQPNIDGLGFFGVNTQALPPAGRIHFELSQNITEGPLFTVDADEDEDDLRIVTLLNRVYTADFLSSVGISPFLAAALDIPIHFYAQGENFNSGDSFTEAALGDIKISLKFRLLEETPKRPGFSLLFHNSFPTGNERLFLGTSHMVPGADLLAGKTFKYFALAGNFGVRFPWQKQFLGFDFNDQMTYGLAVKVPFQFWDPLFSVIGEIRGHFNPNHFEVATAPLEFVVGLRKEFKNGFSLLAGGGGGWTGAIGNPRFRGILSAGYSFLVGKSKKKEEKPIPPPPEAQPVQPELPPQPEPAPEIVEPISEPLPPDQPIEPVITSPSPVSPPIEGGENREISQIPSPSMGDAVVSLSNQGEGEGVKVKIFLTVYFKNGTDMPTGESAGWIADTVQKMKTNPQIIRYKIVGYTDQAGSGMEELSKRRAESVKNLLIKQGITASILVTESGGASHPATENPASRRVLNNRVELTGESF